MLRFRLECRIAPLTQTEQDVFTVNGSAALSMLEEAKNLPSAEIYIVFVDTTMAHYDIANKKFRMSMALHILIKDQKSPNA